MSQSNISSPARSQGVPPSPQRRQTRSTRSLGSPASNSSARLSSVVEQFKENNRESFAVSPLGKSMLTDNTEIDMPRRKSWWKKVDQSREVLEVMNDNQPLPAHNVLEEFDVEVLTQERKEYTMDLPDSSDSESINSIVVPQRKLFTQKDVQEEPQRKYGQVIGNRETLSQQNKTAIADKTATANIGPKNLFGQGPKRSKPVFPAALLNVSLDKTAANKTREIAAEVKAPAKSLFGNRPGKKRKNMFADFIVSDSEDDISEIQPKMFAFAQNKNPVRHSRSMSRGIREPSPTSSVTTDIEMDDWKMLPSSTMVEHQLEAAMATSTPGKRTRLSKLSEAKESVNTNSTVNKSNKSLSRKSKTYTLEGANAVSLPTDLDGNHPTTKPIEPNKTVGQIEIPTENMEIESDNNKVAVNKLAECNNLTDATNKFDKLNKSLSRKSKTYVLEGTTEANKSADFSEDQNKNSAVGASQSDGQKGQTENLNAFSNQNEVVAEEIVEAQHSTITNVLEGTIEANLPTNPNIEPSKNIESESIITVGQIDVQTKNLDTRNEENNEVVNKTIKDIIIEKNQNNNTKHTEQESEPNNVSKAKIEEENEDQIESIGEVIEGSQNRTTEKIQNETEPNLVSGAENEENDVKEIVEEGNENKSTEQIENEAEINNINNVLEAESEEEKIANESLREEVVEESVEQDTNEEKINEQMESETELNNVSEEENEEDEIDNVSDAESVENEEDNIGNDSETKSEQNEEDDMSNVSEAESEQNEKDEIGNVSEAENDKEEIVNESSKEDIADESQNKSSEQIENETETNEVSEAESEQNDENDEIENEEIENNGTNQTENESETPNTFHETEEMIRNKTNEMHSFTARGRNTSGRNTENFSIRPSFDPPRDSTDFRDGTKNSSAEGSGWDSHRTTRKTLRQTFGKDFTPRKSLRALVMEKSAKRQTLIDAANEKLHQANSTELPDESDRHDEQNFDDHMSNAENLELEESIGTDDNVHEISKRTRQATLEMYLHKMKKDNMERKRIIEEQVRNSFKSNPFKDHDFKVPTIPTRRKAKPLASLQTAPKVKRIRPTLIPVEDLPEELIEDMKYKPPKRFKPSNAAWITNRLYRFLEGKLEPRYDYKARVRAEKLVQAIYIFVRDTRRDRVAPPHMVAELKKEMARLEVVTTHHDFYNFFNDFMPYEVGVKVVPDIVNDIPLPKDGVFSDIIVP